jgi:hypothetical protein
MLLRTIITIGITETETGLETITGTMIDGTEKTRTMTGTGIVSGKKN